MSSGAQNVSSDAQSAPNVIPRGSAGERPVDSELDDALDVSIGPMPEAAAGD